MIAMSWPAKADVICELYMNIQAADLPMHHIYHSLLFGIPMPWELLILSASDSAEFTRLSYVVSSSYFELGLRPHTGRIPRCSVQF